MLALYGAVSLFQVWSARRAGVLGGPHEEVNLARYLRQLRRDFRARLMVLCMFEASILR